MIDIKDAKGLNNADVQKLLDIDPLQVAEDLTGESYKDSQTTTSIGFLLGMTLGGVKERMLKERNDTTLSNKLDYYQSVIADIGFELAAQFPFTGSSYSDDPAHEETLFIYAHRQYGIILVFDTFCGDRVNGGNFFYCWRKNPDLGNEAYSVTSNGSYESESEPDWRKTYDEGSPKDLYWAGHHDCREAIRCKIEQLAENGTFFPKWPASSQGRKKGGMYFMHYMDWKSEEYNVCRGSNDAYINRIFLERYSALPQFAKDIIGNP